MLILIVCLAVSPDICRAEQPHADVAGAISCVSEGQLIALQRLDDNPEMDATRLAVSIRQT